MEAAWLVDHHTISQSGVEMGRLAGELLFDMMVRGAGRDGVADIVLAAKLVAGQCRAGRRPSWRRGVGRAFPRGLIALGG